MGQPGNSRILFHPAWQFILDFLGVYGLLGCGTFKAQTYMGAFGGSTLKEHFLLSNKRWVYGMAKDRPPSAQFNGGSQVVKKEIVVKNGSKKQRVTGGPDLKGTENYTDEFGQSLLQLYLAYADKFTSKQYDINEYDRADISFTAWSDLDLSDVMEQLVREMPANM